MPLRSRPLRLLAATWEGLEEEALRGLLEEGGTAAVVRFSVKAGRFLRELASDPQAALHTLSGERVKDLNRLMVSEIEVVMPNAAARGC